jgi:NAD(P)-dependent dehydrogenase (short-subunit alcohol dehydrogenase family)
MTSPQIVLITGANQGLGYFAALQLSKLPGYHVLVGSRDAAKGANAVKQIEAEGASFLAPWPFRAAQILYRWTLARVGDHSRLGVGPQHRRRARGDRVALRPA